jgi:diguanylate cyclase (GGDEF)-like protein
MMPTAPLDSMTSEPLLRDRLLVISGMLDQRDMVSTIRAYCPNREVTHADTPLAGIAKLVEQPAQHVLICTDSATQVPVDALAGLREAAGDEVKLIICCPTEAEPAARRLVGAGADDYVLLPLEADELTNVLGDRAIDVWAERPFGGVPAASLDELHRLSELLGDLGGQPRQLVERLAELLRQALNATGVQLVVHGTAVTAGTPVRQPVISAPLGEGRTSFGQMVFGPAAAGTYHPADLEKLTQYSALATHILQAATQHRRWRELALTDELSGLPNRRCLYEQLDELLLAGAQQRQPVTLVLIDVDDFKTYNDEFGHDAGDEIIRTTARLFRESCREQDLVCRYGGDEFVMVFCDPAGPRVTGSQHPASALQVLQRFRQRLSEQHSPKLGPHGEGTLTISAGLATYPWDATSRDELISKADEALRNAKRAGKNRIFLIGSKESTE